MGRYISGQEDYRQYLIEMEYQMEDTPTPFKPDSIVQSIIDKFIERARKGKEKYFTHFPGKIYQTRVQSRLQTSISLQTNLPIT